MIDEQEWKLRADEALELLYRELAELSDEHGFEVDGGGTVTVEFDNPPAKFVVSPNSPVQQIWVSANAKSYKLDWDAAREEFVLPATGESLRDVVVNAAARQLGVEL